MRRCGSACWGSRVDTKYGLEFPGCVRGLRTYVLHAESPRLCIFDFQINAEHALEGVHEQDADESMQHRIFQM